MHKGKPTSDKIQMEILFNKASRVWWILEVLLKWKSFMKDTYLQSAVYLFIK